jgi:hypothetical protein
MFTQQVDAALRPEFDDVPAVDRPINVTRARRRCQAQMPP